MQADSPFFDHTSRFYQTRGTDMHDSTYDAGLTTPKNLTTRKSSEKPIRLVPQTFKIGRVEVYAPVDQADGIDVISIDPSRMLYSGMERGLPWSEYPVVRDFRPDFPSISFLHPKVHQDVSLTKVITALKRSDQVVIDMTTVDPHTPKKDVEWLLASAGFFLRSVSFDGTVLVRDHGYNQDTTDIHRLIDPVRADTFLQDNYIRNARVILQKAYDSAITEVEKSASLRTSAFNPGPFKRSFPHKGIGTIRSIENLQFLIALQEATLYERSKLYEAMVSSDFSQCNIGRTLRGGLWHGSGKYPVRKIGIDGKMSNIIFCLITDKLVDFDEAQGHLFISDAGKRLLDILHRDNRDPDCLLRWFDPDDNRIKPDRIDEIRDWLQRFFRKLKVRINNLP